MGNVVMSGIGKLQNKTWPADFSRQVPLSSRTSYKARGEETPFDPVRFSTRLANPRSPEYWNILDSPCKSHLLPIAAAYTDTRDSIDSRHAGSHRNNLPKTEPAVQEEDHLRALQLIREFCEPSEPSQSRERGIRWHDSDYSSAYKSRYRNGARQRIFGIAARRLSELRWMQKQGIYSYTGRLGNRPSCRDTSALFGACRQRTLFAWMSLFRT